MGTNFRNFLRDADDGATALEYGLIASMIAIAIMAAVRVTGQELVKPFESASNALVEANVKGN